MKNIIVISALMGLFLSCFLIFQPEIENNPKADLSEKLKSPKKSVLTSGPSASKRRIKVNRPSVSTRGNFLSYYQNIIKNEKRMDVRDDLIHGIICRMASYDPYKALVIANDIESKAKRGSAKRSIVKSLTKTDPSQALEIANGIEGKRTRDNAKEDIVKSLAKTDPYQALEIAISIKYRLKALENILMTVNLFKPE